MASQPGHPSAAAAGERPALPEKLDAGAAGILTAHAEEKSLVPEPSGGHSDAGQMALLLEAQPQSPGGWGREGGWRGLGAPYRRGSSQRPTLGERPGAQPQAHHTHWLTPRTGWGLCCSGARADVKSHQDTQARTPRHAQPYGPTDVTTHAQISPQREMAPLRHSATPSLKT